MTVVTVTVLTMTVVTLTVGTVTVVIVVRDIQCYTFTNSQKEL